MNVFGGNGTAMISWQQPEVLTNILLYELTIEALQDVTGRCRVSPNARIVSAVSGVHSGFVGERCTLIEGIFQPTMPFPPLPIPPIRLQFILSPFLLASHFRPHLPARCVHHLWL